ncbi:cellulose binding domain-containing protein [Haloactinospora alba]|uniref:Cellulose binding domain-containing protein n=1 Tax=Haloactinospora alba TaxID=405555 RepID=A0A543NFS9_9ACTN|nr:cellulose binding domain-containing protein [Haloactinospora alba]TQN30685.1 cellulose binding domain-containing protein [Haloactinospora alba]
MRRRDADRRGRRGAHRAEPHDAGKLATLTRVLESTVPRKVRPPHVLTVLVLSGVTLALTLFAYSTTQIHLKFSGPPTGRDAAPDTGSQHLEPSAGTAEPSAPPGAGTAGVRVTYRTVDSSETGFTGQVALTNTGDEPVEEWRLALGFPDAEVTSAWNADWQVSGSSVRMHPAEDTAAIAPGQTATIGFTAHGPEQEPSSCSLNGRACGI